jgi:hypothetical protein
LCSKKTSFIRATNRKVKEHINSTLPEKMSGSQRREAKDDENATCCTWSRIILLVLVLAVSGVLIWKFAPVDEAINSILPSYNSTNGGSTDNGGGTGGTGSGNDNNNVAGEMDTPAPTNNPTYPFMQCGADSEDCCNGLDTICDLRADEILYATLHNAMATFEDGFLFGPNHRYKLEGAIQAGYRGLNLDICNCGGEHIFW